jgi:hypothetical protein
MIEIREYEMIVGFSKKYEYILSVYLKNDVVLGNGYWGLCSG